MRLVLTAALLILAGMAQARTLSMSDAVQLARQHSLSMKKAAAADSAARSALDAARAERLPTLSASATSGYVSFVPTLNIEIAPGRTMQRDVGTHENYQADLRLALPLYTGGRLSASISLADANRSYADALSNLSQAQVEYLARQEYYTLIRADQLIQVAAASLHRTETLERDIASLYQAGAADSVAILEIGLVLSKARFALRQAEINRRSSELRLLTVVGLEPVEHIAPADTLSVPAQSSWSADVSATKPELLASTALVAANEGRYRLARADYLPTLSAVTGYSYGKPNLDRFNDVWNGYATVGASLNWSFNLGGKTASSRRVARYNLNSALYDRDQIAENLGRDAQLAVEQLKLAYERYTNALEQYGITQANYRLTTKQHRDGVLSSNRLITIEADLTSAQAATSATLVDFHLARNTYEYAIGSNLNTKGN